MALLLNKYQKPVPLEWSKWSIEKFAGIVSERINYSIGDGLEGIIESLHGKIVYLEPGAFDLTDSGSIVIEEDRSFRIFLSSFTPPLRDRFTIAHDLGHFFLHAEGRGPFRAERYGSGRTEWEANWFAAAFLMPEREIRKAIDEWIGVSDMSLRFRVLNSIIETRLNDLGLCLEHK